MNLTDTVSIEAFSPMGTALKYQISNVDNRGTLIIQKFDRSAVSRPRNLFKHHSHTQEYRGYSNTYKI